VVATCEDGTSYASQVLVGADGAHSIVRKNIYSQLAKKNKLPACDREELAFKSVCLIGQTVPLGPTAFPEINDPRCTLNFMIGKDKPFTVRFLFQHFRNRGGRGVNKVV